MITITVINKLNTIVIKKLSMQSNESAITLKKRRVNYNEQTEKYHIIIFYT